MLDIADLNVKVVIAFALVTIVGLLTYIAFFKEPIKKGPSPRRPRQA